MSSLHLVAYSSLVVIVSSWPAKMGMSTSPGVLPVRISGPFVSSAIARGRPNSDFSAARVFSITLLKYCLQLTFKYEETTSWLP